MRIWLRRHRIVTALLLAALALAGTAGILFLYSLDSWLILPLREPFPRLRPTGRTIVELGACARQVLCRCQDADICQTSVSSSAPSSYVLARKWLFLCR